MKKIVFALMLVYSLVSFAQKTEGEIINVTAEASKKAIDTTNMGWKSKGNFLFLFNQSAFNNDWQSGGTSNIAGNLSANYDFNYKTLEMIWDNKLIVAYGLTQLKGLDAVKSDDRLEFTSLLGKKAEGNWFYSGFLNFRTQMDTGLVSAGTDPITNQPLFVRNSHFFSPAYLQAGPGLLWKKSDDLKINIAPATSRLIFVDGHFTQFASAFGVAQGETTRFEFGAAVSGYYKLTLIENVTMENILNLYSNYLEKPQNVDINYQMNLVMKINKYLSTNVAFQAIYDDNATKGFQIKEVFGLGFNATF
jgi:hypothetical protein